MKQCGKCNNQYELSDYHVNTDSRDGRYSICKSCKLAANRRRDFGLSADEVQQLHDSQNGLCKICRRVLGKRYCIDHDHDDGHVRGILCNRCNVGLGQFGDDMLLLELAIEYLKTT